MKPNEEECYICGEVMNRYWMEQIGTGRSVRWMCPGCFRNGGRQADRLTKRMLEVRKKKENR